MYLFLLHGKRMVNLLVDSVAVGTTEGPNSTTVVPQGPPDLLSHNQQHNQGTETSMLVKISLLLKSLMEDQI